jgi:hypothetical protein
MILSTFNSQLSTLPPLLDSLGVPRYLLPSSSRRDPEVP